MIDVQQLNDRVQRESTFVTCLRDELKRVIIGQDYMLNRLIVGLLSNGHILIEGVPGLAKTLAVKSLAGAIQAKFSRIQFTPDLLPADLIGTLIYNPKDGNFTTKKGPIFANIILADEINRAPAKVQSALLEAMQEHQVTIGEKTHVLEEPFLVLATQNPIEQEGTYPLPEAQVDRFMLKLKVGYPNKKEERAIQDRMAHVAADTSVAPVVTTADIMRARSVVEEIFMDDKIKDYIVDIVFATREPEAYKLNLKQYIQYGASPRATLYLTMAAKAHAFISGRGYVTPQDVKSIGLDVLRHRIIVSYEAEAEDKTADQIVQSIFDAIEVP